jgi:hypothetical protein
MANRRTSYGRNWKKWLAICAALGVVVFCIVYFGSSTAVAAAPVPEEKGCTDWSPEGIAGTSPMRRYWPGSGQATPMYVRRPALRVGCRG